MSSLLTNADYENLLKFHLFINSNYERFISRVLFYITENFAFPLVAHTVFNKNSKGEIYVEEIRSESFHAETLQSYKNGLYKSDPFFQRASTLYKQTSVSQKHLYTIDDITTREDFFDTAYGQSLVQQDICNQIIVHGALSKTVPFHILSIFKTEHEEDFTPREIELLRSIGNTFSKSVDLYKKYMEHKSFEFYLTSFCDDQSAGLAILDGQLKTVYCNRLFLKFISETYDITEYNNNDAAVMAVMERARERHTVQPEKLTETFSFQEGKYDICFQPHHYFNGEFVSRFLFITTQVPHRLNTTSKLNPAAFDQYNFSPREAEIIDLIARGYDNKKIANDLFISLSTAKFHIRNIFNKLGVTSRTAAIAKILKTDHRDTVSDSDKHGEEQAE